MLTHPKAGLTPGGASSSMAQRKRSPSETPMHLLTKLVLASRCSLRSCRLRPPRRPKAGGTLTYAVTAEPPSTDCHAITTYAAVHVLAPHYSLLLKVDQDDYPKLKPDSPKAGRSRRTA